MLVARGAEQWKVPATRPGEGRRRHSGTRKATFGELADAAPGSRCRPQVTLKDPKDFVYIGKDARRTDSKRKSNGTARFTQDVKLPDMLTAVVLHAPRFGRRCERSTRAVTGIPGVRYVVEIPNGVAVHRDHVLGREEGTRRAQGRMGSSDRLEGTSEHCWPITASSRPRRASRRRRRRREGDRRGARSSTRRTSFRTSRTPRWSP
jgi:isoquinoline 1-oxidoreductase beta subunit